MRNEFRQNMNLPAGTKVLLNCLLENWIWSTWVYKNSTSNLKFWLPTSMQINDIFAWLLLLRPIIYARSYKLRTKWLNIGCLGCVQNLLEHELFSLVSEILARVAMRTQKMHKSVKTKLFSSHFILNEPTKLRLSESCPITERSERETNRQHAPWPIPTELHAGRIAVYAQPRPTPRGPVPRWDPRGHEQVLTSTCISYDVLRLLLRMLVVYDIRCDTMPSDSTAQHV